MENAHKILPWLLVIVALIAICIAPVVYHRYFVLDDTSRAHTKKRNSQQEFFNAVKKGDSRRVAAILKQHKIDIDAQNKDGKTALIVAVQKADTYQKKDSKKEQRYLTMLQVLLQAGAQVSEEFLEYVASNNNIADVYHTYNEKAEATKDELPVPDTVEVMKKSKQRKLTPEQFETIVEM